MVGLQHKDISEIMNINEESARKLLYRAIENFASTLMTVIYQRNFF